MTWRQIFRRGQGCEHQNMIRGVTPSGDGCVECLQMNDTWVHLRLCLTCGHVGCCDESRNTHARKHAAHEEHPIIKSFEPGEDWMWCYVDEVRLVQAPGSA